MHVQITSVDSKVAEIAVRGNSVECNTSSGRFKAVRVAGRRWAIISTDKDSDDLVERAKVIASEGGEGVELAEAELAVGDFRFKAGYFDEEYAVELLMDLKKNFDGFVEAVLTHEKIFREIKTSDGADAREEKEITDLNLSVAEKHVASLHVGGIGGLEVIENKFEFLIEELKSRLENLKKAKRLNPLMRGFKFNVILAKEVACAFVHEIVHKLEADVIGEVEDGDCITIYDDPTGFGGYHFDDEGVLAREKCLVDNGKVVSYLHTRETAFKFKEVPMGNGRGFLRSQRLFRQILSLKKVTGLLMKWLKRQEKGLLRKG